MDNPPWDPDGQQRQSQLKNGYDPIDQASGYTRFALYRFACYQLELKRFLSRHGGLWLCSDVETEQAVADAIYEVGWCSPLNEEDDAYLRRTLADTRHEEQDHFTSVLLTSTRGEDILADWHNWVFSCTCTNVETGDTTPDDPIPACLPHRMIRACQTYCNLIDNDWLKIADWYRPDATNTHGTRQGQLYEEHIRRLRAGDVRNEKDHHDLQDQLSDS